MPIELGFRIEPLNDRQFDEIDYKLMGCAYAIQNEFGRLLNENLYQKELAFRMNDHYECLMEAPIRLTHKTFIKQLYIDLLIANGLVCEIKVAESTADAHLNQLIQYMLLANASHGKLVNFGTSSVDGKLINSFLSPQSRLKLTFNFERWNQKEAQSQHFSNLATELLEDWGGFLAGETYLQALTHLLGGEEKVVREIDILSAGRIVYRQKARLLNDETAFKLTTIKGDRSNYRSQLKKFLSSSKLQFVHWINLNKHEVVFETVKKN